MKSLLFLSAAAALDLKFQTMDASGKDFTVQEFLAGCNAAWPLFFKQARCEVTSGDKCEAHHRAYRVKINGSDTDMNAAKLHEAKVSMENNEVVIDGFCGKDAVRFKCSSDDQHEASFFPLCQNKNAIAGDENIQVFHENATKAILWLAPKIAPHNAKTPINFRVIPIGATADAAQKNLEAFKK